MENEAQSIEDFASELGEAETPEQPIVESGQPDLPEGEGGQPVEGQDPPEGSDADPEDPDQVEQPEGESAAEGVHKWKTASGEEFEVTTKELRDGYLRDQDYRHKTTAAAENFRKENANVQERVQILGQMAEEIGQFQSIQRELSQYEQVDWNRLQVDDPAQFAALRTQQLTLIEQARGAQHQLAQKHQYLQHAAQQHHHEQRTKAVQYLREKVPGVNVDALTRECVQAGYTQEQLARVSNSLLVHDLWKARQWDALQAKKPQVQNRVRALPPVTASRPQRGTAPTTKHQEVAKAIGSKRTFSASEFAGLLKNSR